MKLYLSASLLLNLLNSSYKKKIGSELESLLHDGNRFSTSVYSLLMLMKSLRLENSEKWRTILHLVGELVEEILPIDRKVLEIVCENKEPTVFSIELAIAQLSGNDEVLICEEIGRISSPVLPLRNFFRKADR